MQRDDALWETMNVFPIKAGAKYPPLVKGWQHKAKPREQWIGLDHCNFGVHCAGMLVVDVDPKNGGTDSFDMLEMIYGFPPTRNVRTPSSGTHLYYLLPDGHPGVANRPLAPGIDIKSTGGYVLAAGSKIEAGSYVSDGVPLTQAPDWLIERCGTAAAPSKHQGVEVPDATAESLERAQEWLKGRPIGDEAYATTCGLRDFGLSQEQALGAMLRHDGRPASLLEPKVRHAYTYASGEPGAKITTAAEFDALPADQVPPMPPPRAKHGPRRFLALTQGDGAGPGYIVKGLLQRASHAVLYGPPGAGKTFVALDIAYHVAAGQPWMERRVKAGLVLYLAYEGIGGIAKRAQALRKVYGDADVPLYVQAADYNLRVPEGRKSLGATLAELPEKPVLIVIDTLARAMKGGDENSAKDMGELNDAVAALIESTGACVMLVHHSGKNKGNGARGSSALLGAVDTEIEVDGWKIRSTKQRDVELGDPIGFELHTHQIGIDEDGDAMFSCTVAARDISKNGGPVWTEAFILGVLTAPVDRTALRKVCEAKYEWSRQKFDRELKKEENLGCDREKVWYCGDDGELNE